MGPKIAGFRSFDLKLDRCVVLHQNKCYLEPNEIKINNHNLITQPFSHQLLATKLIEEGTFDGAQEEKCSSWDTGELLGKSHPAICLNGVGLIFYEHQLMGMRGSC